MDSKKLIAIHSVPRSGSSWLGEIINSSANVKYCFQPLFSYAFKSALNEYSTKKQIEQFFLDIEKTEDDFINQKKERERGEKPIFDKEIITHIAYKEVRYHYILENLLKQTSSFKAVLLIRNPLAVLNSFKNAPREFRSDLGWKFENEWRYAQRKNENRREEYFGYEQWKEISSLYLDLKEKWPERVYVLSYEELVASTEKIVKELFSFCSIDYNHQTEKFIHKSSNTHTDSPYSVFKDKSVVSKWEIELDPYISNEISSDLTGTRLERFIYSENKSKNER